MRSLVRSGGQVYFFLFFVGRFAYGSQEEK